MYKDVTRKSILQWSRGVLTARDWIGQEALVLHRVLLAEFSACPELWAKDYTLETGKRPNLDPGTRLSISLDHGSWSEPFHFVSLLRERDVFVCVIKKSGCLQSQSFSLGLIKCWRISPLKIAVNSEVHTCKNRWIGVCEESIKTTPLVLKLSPWTLAGIPETSGSSAVPRRA